MGLSIDKSLNISLTRGDTASLEIKTYRRNAAGNPGEPYELADTDTLLFTVKRSVNDEECLIRKAVTGSNVITLDHADTAGLQFGRYRYDIKFKPSDGVFDTITGLDAPWFRVCEGVG